MFAGGQPPAVRGSKVIEQCNCFFLLGTTFMFVSMFLSQKIAHQCFPVGALGGALVVLWPF